MEKLSDSFLTEFLTSFPVFNSFIRLGSRLNIQTDKKKKNPHNKCYHHILQKSSKWLHSQSFKSFKANMLTVVFSDHHNSIGGFLTSSYEQTCMFVFLPT